MDVVIKWIALTASLSLVMRSQNNKPSYTAFVLHNLAKTKTQCAE